MALPIGQGSGTVGAWKRAAAGEDSELNMTPMIDIVFQLIIFFLLSLKFKDIDSRIDAALPHDRGMASIPTPAEDLDACKVKVFVRNLGTEQQRTVMRVGHLPRTYALPTKWRGHLHESPVRVRDYQAVMAALRNSMQRQVQGVEPGKRKGEIVAPEPRGGSVPHGDVMAIINEFLRLGVTDVVFEGTRKPQ